MTQRVLQFNNLPEGYTKERLHEQASTYGQVEEAQQKKNTGWVRFKAVEHAQAAFNDLKEKLKADGIVVKLESLGGGFKLLLLLLVLLGVYYFVVRKFLFSRQSVDQGSIPKDPIYETEPTSAHYPRYKLKANTLNNYVKSGAAKSHRETTAKDKGKKEPASTKAKKLKKAQAQQEA